MKRTLITLLVLGTLGAGSLMAEDNDGRWNQRHDYADRTADYRDMNRDRANITEDQAEVRQDLREGRYAAAQRERAELRSRVRDLNRDRVDTRRDIRHDRDWR